MLHAVRYEDNYKAGKWIPLGGLELQFNKQLQGKEGKKLFIRAPKLTIDAQKVLSSPQPGEDIYLSINPYLQAVAESALEEGVNRAEAKKGSALIMDPQTGQLWAIAHYPYFNPQHYSWYYEDASRLEYTKPFSIQEVFEPGSLAKPFYLFSCHDG